MGDNGDTQAQQPKTMEPESLKVAIPLGPRKSKIAKKRNGKRRGKNRATAGAAGLGKGGRSRVAFPKHPLAKCLRIPQGVLDQNAGNECTDREALDTRR